MDSGRSDCTVSVTNISALALHSWRDFLGPSHMPGSNTHTHTHTHTHTQHTDTHTHTIHTYTHKTLSVSNSLSFSAFFFFLTHSLSLFFFFSLFPSHIHTGRRRRASFKLLKYTYT